MRSWRILALTPLAALLCGGLLAQPAAAQDNERSEPRESRFIRFLDTDGNGTVSLDEIKAEHARLIAASDLNGDDQLSADEFRRRGRLFQALAATTLFDLLDTDGNQQITSEELANPTARWFSRYDANSDGELEASEAPQRRWRRR